jgi:hypothetical protein
LLTQLGELQVKYHGFQTTMKETQQLFSRGYYQRRKSALEKDLQYLSSLKQDAFDQQKLVAADQELQQKELEAYEKLAEEKVIAPLELNQYKSRLIAKQQTLGQAGSQVTNNDINSHGKRKELLDLQKTMMDLEQQFRSEFYTLKSEVEEWMQRFVVSASVDGRLEFISFLQENQLLTAGQLLFFIQPEQSNYYAEMKCGQSGFGKIREQQKVIVKLGSYPSAEFGYIEGRISYISSLPNARDSFLVKVELPKGLLTNYNKTIGFRNNLAATAEVITDDRKLIDRLLGRFRQL